MIAPGTAPRVSVIIVTWNALPLLKQCLPSVVATRYPDLEIILADNASTDRTVAWVSEHFPRIRLVRHPENWAFCRGNNAAVPYATGSYLVFLNNDVEVTPDWLVPLVEAFEAIPDLAAAQPKLLHHADRTRFEYAGASGGFLDRLGYPFARGRLFFTVETDVGQYDDARDVFWATGAALMVRRSALERVGLFDEHFFMHMEEIDLCWRFLRHGYRIRVIPDSVVYHVGGGSLARDDARKVYYNFRNSLLMLYKNLPARDWRPVFAQRLLIDGLAALHAALRGRPREAVAIVRAYRDAHRMRPLYAESPPTRSVRPPYRNSIVMDYFLRKRHRFSDLPPERFTPIHPAPTD